MTCLGRAGFLTSLHSVYLKMKQRQRKGRGMALCLGNCVKRPAQKYIAHLINDPFGCGAIKAALLAPQFQHVIKEGRGACSSAVGWLMRLTQWLKVGPSCLSEAAAFFILPRENKKGKYQRQKNSRLPACHTWDVQAEEEDTFLSSRFWRRCLSSSTRLHSNLVHIIKFRSGGNKVLCSKGARLSTQSEI